MKLLVFGGTGFVGARVVHKALERGCRVVVASRAGVPSPSTPLHHLALRARVVGGRAAACEAAQQASPPQQVDTTRASTATATGGDHHDGNSSSQHYSDDLTFVRLDATSRSQVYDFLHDHSDADAIISCIGVMTCNYEVARAGNADANVNIAAGVHHAQLVPRVRKYVYVSAEPLIDYLPSVFDHRWTLKGYYHGKRAAEAAALEHLGTRAVVLRPCFIYGTRYVTVRLPGSGLFASRQEQHNSSSDGSTVVPVPLSLVGYPIDMLLRTLHGRGLLTPPVHVDVLAETAVRVCAWAASATQRQLHEDVYGVVNVARMHAICAATDDARADNDDNNDDDSATAARTLPRHDTARDGQKDE